MPQPVTVYRGETAVHNVYPSELQAWLEDGWTTEPQPTPQAEEKTVKRTSRKATTETVAE
jgi:hypothetical protein